MFGKKPPKSIETKKAVCQLCGLDCGDKFSLVRHIDWVHNEQKTTVKS
jgi:hypothetical protein